MKLILLLALCASASAAPLPPSVPVVTRPKPLMSPKASSLPYVTPMTKVPGSTIDPSAPPPLPLKGSAVRVNGQFGTYEFTVEATQPAGQSLLFEKGSLLGEWEPLAYFGPQPFAQQSFAAYYSFQETNFVRARATPVDQPIPQTGWMPASLAPVIGGISRVFVNTNMPGGVRTWSVRK